MHSITTEETGHLMPRGLMNDRENAARWESTVRTDLTSGILPVFSSLSFILRLEITRGNL